MGLASIITLCIIGMVYKDVIAQPCLTIDSMTKFKVTRKALTNMIKKLDDDMESLVLDFEKKQWKKYNGHCYYYGSEKLNWFESEQRCIEIGGHLAKIENAAENKWIIDNRPYKDHLWMGLTDLKEGEFRWSYDQTLAQYSKWKSGWGNKGNHYDCGTLLHNYRNAWIDNICTNTYYYVCETNFCY